MGTHHQAVSYLAQHSSGHTFVYVQLSGLVPLSGDVHRENSRWHSKVVSFGDIDSNVESARIAKHITPPGSGVRIVKAPTTLLRY